MNSKPVSQSRAAGITRCSVHVRKSHPFLPSQTHGLEIGAQTGSQPLTPPRAPLGRGCPPGLFANWELLRVCWNLFMFVYPQHRGLAPQWLRKRFLCRSELNAACEHRQGCSTHESSNAVNAEGLRPAQAGWIMSSVLFPMESGYSNICRWKLFRAVRRK